MEWGVGVKLFQRDGEAGLETINWQKVVDRNSKCIGYEALACLSNMPRECVGRAISKMSDFEARKLTSEMLSLVRAKSMVRPRFVDDPLVRIFIKIEKQSLLDRQLVEEIVKCSVDMRKRNYQLAVGLTDRAVGNRDLASYVEALYRLKDAAVYVALEDYMISGLSHLELRLELCDLVKLDVANLGIFPRFANDAFVNGYERTYNAVVDFLQFYGVPLLAEGVENDWQAHIVSSMPFEFFQGCYFGRPSRTLGMRL